MANTLSVTILPAGAVTIGAKWGVEVSGVITWYASADVVTLTHADYVIHFKYIEGYYLTAYSATMHVDGVTTGTITYETTSWYSTWAPPIAITYWRGQVFTGGNVDLDADARKVRWSEIGAMRFLGASANPQRNEAGEFHLPNTTSFNTNIPMRLLPLSNAMIVYGSGGVYALTPVSQPVPGFGVETLEELSGIMNPLAVAGGEKMHVLVDNTGWLFTVSASTAVAKTKVTSIGYADIFSSMQKDFSIATGKGLISVVWNKDSDEYYISDGRRSFLFTGAALTELSKAYTSYINIHDSMLSRVDKNLQPYSAVYTLSTDPYLYVETEILDFNISAIKTINSVEIVGSFGTDAIAEVMVKWRNNRSGLFRDTPWRRCSPAGFCAPQVSGSDLKLCVRVRNYKDVVISGLMVEWQLSDKTSVRGSYTNVNSSSPDSGQ
jgi:hypothetical protein